MRIKFLVFALSVGLNSAHPSQGSPVYDMVLASWTFFFFSPLHRKLPLRPLKKKDTDAFCLKCLDFLWHKHLVSSLNQTLPLVY